MEKEHLYTVMGCYRLNRNTLIKLLSTDNSCIKILLVTLFTLNCKVYMLLLNKQMDLSYSFRVNLSEKATTLK